MPEYATISADDDDWPAATGEIAYLLRAHDWSKTPLGPRTGWSAELRATLELMLGCGFPMALRLGREQRLLYNDAYSRIVGERHPQAFGMPSAQVFHEVGNRFEAEFARVLAGATVVLPNQCCPLFRHGRMVDAWFDVSLSPYRAADGTVQGTLSTLIETTTRVLAERRSERIEATLREREARLQQALEGSELGTWTWEPQPDRVQFDARAREILGLALNDFPSLRAMQATMLHPADRQEVAGRLDASTDPAGDGRFDSEHRLRRHDGSEIWLRQTGQARFEDVEGTRVARLVVGTLQDITARRQAEAASRESEARYRLLFDSIDQGFCLIDVLFDANDRPYDYRFVEVNDSFTRQTDLVDVIGRCITELAPGHEPHWFEHYGRIAVTGEAESFIEPAKAVGGRWYEVYAFRVGDPALRRVGVLFNDITCRHASERALRDSEMRLSTLVEGIPQMVWRAQGGGDATWTSPQWSAFTGQSLEESLGIGWLEVIHPDDREASLQAWSRALRAGVLQVDHRVRRHDGVHVWHATRARPLHDTDGNVIEWLGTTTDVQRLMELQEEKDRLVLQLAETDRRKDEFLATLAHELRNPLAPLTNAVHVIGLCADDPQRVEAMRQMIDRQLRHMVRLVDDLLDISRISRGQITLRRSRVDVAQAVRAAIETSRPVVDAHAHVLQVELPETPLPVFADETRLAQLVANLITNAAKYTPRGGHLHVRVALGDDGRVDIVVRDDGIGIPPSLLPHVFEMFVQAPGARGRSMGGLGLGLAIAQRIAEMHGGTLTGHSDGLGTGSTFVLSLPVADAVAPEVQDEVHAGGYAPLRVLVVDDNRDAADSLASLLRAMGQDVRVAYGGGDGLALAQTFAPHLALLDIGMPDMDGHALARAIRRWEATTADGGDDILLVALTGWGQLDDRERSRAAGFDEHIAKPIDGATLERLLARVPPGVRA